MLIPEAPIVNPNAALGTPPRLNSDGEADHDTEGIVDNSGTDEGIFLFFNLLKNLVKKVFSKKNILF